MELCVTLSADPEPVFSVAHIEDMLLSTSAHEFPVGLMEIVFAPMTVEFADTFHGKQTSSTSVASAGVPQMSLTVKINKTLEQMLGYSQQEVQWRMQRYGTRGLFRCCALVLL